MDYQKEIASAIGTFAHPIDQLTSAIENLQDERRKETCDKKVQEIMKLLIDIEYAVGDWHSKSADE